MEKSEPIASRTPYPPSFIHSSQTKVYPSSASHHPLPFLLFPPFSLPTSIAFIPLITHILLIPLTILIPQTPLTLLLLPIFPILINIIRNLPKSSRTSGTVTIKVLVEPVAEYASAAAGAADLDSFATPAFFAREGGGC
jgi:hypothetical protein